MRRGISLIAWFGLDLGFHGGWAGFSGPALVMSLVAPPGGRGRPLAGPLDTLGEPGRKSPADRTVPDDRPQKPESVRRIPTCLIHWLLKSTVDPLLDSRNAVHLTKLCQFAWEVVFLIFHAEIGACPVISRHARRSWPRTGRQGLVVPGQMLAHGWFFPHHPAIVPVGTSGRPRPDDLVKEILHRCCDAAEHSGGFGKRPRHVHAVIGPLNFQHMW